MRTKVTLVLIFLNVALFFFIFKFERQWRTDALILETRRRVLGPEATDIRTLEVTSAVPGGSFRLLREGDTWMLAKPFKWPANPHAVSSLVHELQLLEHVKDSAPFNVADLAKNGQHLSDYGLDQPKLTVAFSSDEKTPPAVLRIGDATKDGVRLYVLSPDGARVHVVNRALVETLSRPLDQLRADTLFTIPVFEARALSVRTASSDQARAAAAPSVRVRIRRDAARWSFETPVIAAASRSAVEIAISGLNALHAKTFNPPNPPTVRPADAPAFRITLDGNNRSETLFLGEALGSTAITAGPATAPDVEYYAQLEGRTALFTVAVPAVLTDALRNAPFTLREKRLLDFDPAAVTAITLTSPVQPNQSPVTLQRLDLTGAADSARWQIVRRSDSAPGPQTMPADRAAVQRLLAQLTSLAAKNFQTDASTSTDLENWGFNRPEREVTLTLAGTGAPAPEPVRGPLVLQLGTDTKRSSFYALVGPTAAPGSSIYEVEAAILSELKIAPRSLWRERLVQELSPAARIVALKLTELATSQVLLDVTFDAAGVPTAPLREPTAVQTLLGQLRTLRAKNFVQDGFSEKVTVAGDERPWKYKLDATVSLPDGAGGGQTGLKSLLLTERVGGAQQLAGLPESDAVFEIEQPFLDALWVLTYGPRDPGLAPVPAPPAKTP
ncbi:MAG: DUF4340 domain-containing protein [Opitutus sp.]|nr:DUF4340 domain-containing protein [Opitutus sp.]